MVTTAAHGPLDRALLGELLLQPAGPLARLEVLDAVDSTNSYLAREVERDPGAWPVPTLVVAEHQTAGRGRLDRSWQTPPGSALTASLLLEPVTPRETWSWLPLLGGLGTVHALRATAGIGAVLKWPNDILVAPADATDMFGWGRWRKLGGILTEVLPDGKVVVGLGLNVSQTADELPVSSATSIALCGPRVGEPPTREVLLDALAEAISEVLGRWTDAGGDVAAAGLDADVTGVLATAGQEVRVLVSGGREIRGRAVGLGPVGELVVEIASGEFEAVTSGDVQHIRVAGEA